MYNLIMDTPSLINYILRDETDIQRLRAFIKSLRRESNLGDFEEQIQLPDVRSTARLWERGDEIIAVVYVDAGNNLRFEIADGFRSDELEKEIAFSLWRRPLSFNTGFSHVRPRSLDRSNSPAPPTTKKVRFARIAPSLTIPRLAN